MKIAKKREAGEILRRDGLSQRIITLATDIAEGSYKNAIEKAGQIAVLVDCATYDDYWEEKSGIGKNREHGILECMIEGKLTRERVFSHTNPYKPAE